MVLVFTAWLLAAAIGVPVSWARDVGVAAAVNPDAFGTNPGSSRRMIVLGENVIFRQRIETSGSGLVQVLLRDGSTFTVGANSDLVIDEFVYNPADGSGRLVASFGKGVARFVGGKLSKRKGGVAINTTIGTIGIRGGIANIQSRSDRSAFSFLFGEMLTFKGRNGQKRRLYQPGYTLEVASTGRSKVRRTTPRDIGFVQTALTSRPELRGGLLKPPPPSRIARSGLPPVNSGLGAVRTAPRPKPGMFRPPPPLRGTRYKPLDVNIVTRDQIDEDIRRRGPPPP
ncbi:FecR domain-containing protein, partial [Roseibium sp. RKSG952]|uniref:FecR family protein n=1 Tax=Roseibium sp. RKSG952 TaxID=2529384 RepID=UPI0018AD22EC